MKRLTDILGCWPRHCVPTCTQATTSLISEHRKAANKSRNYQRSWSILKRHPLRSLHPFTFVGMCLGETPRIGEKSLTSLLQDKCHSEPILQYFFQRVFLVAVYSKASNARSDIMCYIYRHNSRTVESYTERIDTKNCKTPDECRTPRYMIDDLRSHEITLTIRSV